jgi:hypothetical protein
LFDGVTLFKSLTEFTVPLPDILLITGCFAPGFFLLPGRHIDGFAGHIPLDLSEESFWKDLLCVSIGHGFALLSERIVGHAHSKRYIVFGWKRF